MDACADSPYSPRAMTKSPENAVPPAVEALLASADSIAGSPPDLAAEAVGVALARGRHDLLWKLAEHPDRPIAKAARRALHLLRSRGVDVGEKPAPPPIVTGVAPPAAEEPCWSTLVASSHRAMWIPVNSPLGLALWYVVVSDETGVVHVESGEVSRNQLRRLAASGFGTDAGLETIEIPRARAAALVAEAIARGGAPEMLFAAGELARELGTGDPALLAPPAARAAPADDDPVNLRASAELFDDPLVSLFPPDPVLRALEMKLAEAGESQLVMNERQQSERVGRVVDAAVEDFFTPARRAAIARRLFELCDHWSAAGKPRPAAIAAAAARHLAGTGPILENPFARRMFARLVVKAGPESPQPELEATPERLSPGGLVLPGR